MSCLITVLVTSKWYTISLYLKWRNIVSLPWSWTYALSLTRDHNMFARISGHMCVQIVVVCSKYLYFSVYFFLTQIVGPLLCTCPDWFGFFSFSFFPSMNIYSSWHLRYRIMSGLLNLYFQPRVHSSCEICIDGQILHGRS